MQHIENDMDELFCKAAENYPLKTKIKNWDDIAVILANNAVQAAPVKKSKKKYPGFILFGFFFLLSGVCLEMFFATNQGVHLLSNVNNAAGNSNNIVEENDKAGDTSVVANNSAIHYSYTKRKNILVTKSSKQVSDEKKENSTLLPGENNITGEINIAENKKIVYEIPGEIRDYTQPGEYAGGAGNATHKSDEVKNINSSSDTCSPKLAAQECVKQANTKSGAAKCKLLYAGITTGPQVNQVKGQGFTKASFSAGILAGYKFSKRISVETGVLYSRKYYFSDGKYFDATKAGPAMPANMKVISLNGSSNVFEIPFRFKYNFIVGNRSSWFVSAGTSSYLLTSEHNDYFAVISGSQQNLNSTYANKRGYFSATADLSAGNEFNLGKNNTVLRIAPYLQVPLHGIGIGVIPVYTAGVHIGITLPVKK